MGGLIAAISEKKRARVCGIFSGSGPEAFEKESEADLGRRALTELGSSESIFSPNRDSVRPRVERSGSSFGSGGLHGERSE